VRGDGSDAEKCRCGEDRGDEEGLEGLSEEEGAAEDKEIEPEQTCVVGFESEAEGEAENTGGSEALLEKAPESDDTEADDDAGEIAAGEEEFAVGEKQADEGEGEGRGCIWVA
jgi:hypothetical protein